MVNLQSTVSYDYEEEFILKYMYCMLGLTKLIQVELLQSVKKNRILISEATQFR